MENLTDQSQTLSVYERNRFTPLIISFEVLSAITIFKSKSLGKNITKIQQHVGLMLITNIAKQRIFFN